MVVLDAMPDDGTIRAFKGAIDFYQDKGRTIARRWPQKTRHLPTAAEIDQQNHLREAMAAYNSLAPIMVRHFQLQAHDGNLTSRDLFMKYYFGTYAHSWTPFSVQYPAPEHVPFPDPLGTYWCILDHWRQRSGPSTGRLHFTVSKPGWYRLVWAKHPPLHTMQFYRRRGLDLPGAAHSIDMADVAIKGWLDDTTTHLHFSDETGSSFLSGNVNYVMLQKLTVGGGPACRGSAPVIGVTTTNWFSPGGQEYDHPGGPLTWPHDYAGDFHQILGGRDYPWPYNTRGGWQNSRASVQAVAPFPLDPFG